MSEKLLQEYHSCRETLARVRVSKDKMSISLLVDRSIRIWNRLSPKQQKKAAETYLK